LGFIPYFIKPSLGDLAQPISAHFTYDAPPSLRGLHHYFGTNLEFNQSHNELIYPRSILKQCITEKMDSALLKILREEADKLLLEQKMDNPLKKAIHIFIFKNIGVNKINISDVAKTLNLSLSTLKRRMTSEGIDFRKEKENVRNRMAKQLLSGTTLQVSEVAQKTGFASASAFTRFFIRCNRQAPLKYRNTEILKLIPIKMG
jgi:AraC-like DNA-binding protein